ncbi:hypothetical protein [Psychrobacillus sp. OK032]|uniref:hypothetical protein n=1 Tax=Psychrobacillus sp. OK032 TaxID=1884358 RepID=UPI0008AF7DA7|nr:hypothetical protein [Psychrobacillus sp. OK032]SER88465.1 hypothetical protein SAMN05518872_102493 [Psychrobacillus sp. OK032]
MNPKLKPIANIGDIVTINGYGRRLFRVDAYTHEFMVDEDGTEEDIWYDVSCVNTGEYTIGAHDEVKFVCGATHAEVFIANYDHPVTPSLLSGLSFTVNVDSAENVAPVTPKPKPKSRQQKQAQVDELLDELNDLTLLNEFFGGKDEEYTERIAEVSEKLKAVSGR